MKLIGILILTFLAACLASKIVEDNFKPQALVDLQNLRTNLKTKNEAVGRFIKFLYGNVETTQKPESDEPDSKLSLIQRSFRRLNIFGLQSPPNKPLKDSKELSPEVLFVITNAEVTKEPSFSIVVPDSDIDKTVENFKPVKNHYPKLNLNMLLQQQTNDLHQSPTQELLQPNYYQGFPSGYQQQPLIHQA